MFTGIIEDTGKIIDIKKVGTNKTFRIESSITNHLKIDQSVSHNGICLTVVSKNQISYEVTAIQETLDLTASKHWKNGDILNLERAAQLSARLDGHIVQGHVDATAQIQNIEDENGSWRFTIEFDKKHAALIISKGSVCLDGVSLTVISPTHNTFQVAIIPYTYQHTSFHQYKVGDEINIEFDIIGKYILRNQQLQNLV